MDQTEWTTFLTQGEACFNTDKNTSYGTQVYEKARQDHPNRWSKSTRCWRQPVVVRFNKPPEGHQSNHAVPFIKPACKAAKE
jgi:hypothetical protein